MFLTLQLEGRSTTLGIVLLRHSKGMMVRQLTHQSLMACRWTSQSGWRRRCTRAAWLWGETWPP